jgi:hypothetical protein
MKPPDNAKIYEIANAIYWFDEDGILCMEGKTTDPTTLEQAKQRIETFENLHEGKRFCFLIDYEKITPSSKEVMEYFGSELYRVAKGVAVLTSSPLKKMLVSLVLQFLNKDYPIKIFTDEQDAKKWLKEYL